MIGKVVEATADEGHPINVAGQFIISIILLAAGKVAGEIPDVGDIYNTITMLFQWFAWGGAGTVGAIAAIKFLQDNGILPKGKKRVWGSNKNKPAK